MNVLIDNLGFIRLKRSDFEPWFCQIMVIAQDRDFGNLVHKGSL